MLDTLVQLDKELLVYLNNLGMSFWDPFWLYITKQLNWWPLFLVVFYALYKKISLKQLLLLVIVLALFFVFTDQMTNLVKNTVQRLRPVNDPEINELLRINITRKSWSFFSGHASNSSGAIVFIFMVLRKYYKHAFWLFLFPLIFAYSRIYLALHFPGDIICGYIFGCMSGYLFYRIFVYANKRYHLVDKQKKNVFQ